MISTHILDISAGKPAAGVRVVLSRIQDGHREPVSSGVTDVDGRVKELLSKGRLDAAIYELDFETGPYFRARRVEPFHPRVSVIIEITDPEQHYHVPLLVSPFGYTTYRGS